MTASCTRTEAARLPAEERRRQLVEMGLKVLVELPIHELSLDRVATEAGLSRSLLFHYFPSKSAYYAAVVEAAAGLMLEAVGVATSGPPEERLAVTIGRYLDFVVRHRERYRALVRHAGGADPAVSQILDDVRDELAARLLAAAGLRSSKARAAAARAWIATAEELVLGSGTAVLGRARTDATLIEAFHWMQERFSR